MYINIEDSSLILLYRFLWAEFQLNEICAQVSDNGIKKALERIPKDLNATYERILDSISNKYQEQYELARRVLICVAYSRSPTPMNLLRYAVSVEDDSESMEALEFSLPTETTILDACANLVSIDGDTQESQESRVVRFVHFSVQEFLTSRRPSIETFGLSPESAHREIARMFITLLKILYSRTLVEELLLEHLNMLHEWQYHLINANLGALSAGDYVVTLVTSFFERSPPVPIQGEYEPIFLSFSPPALALIFNLPPGVYQHYQTQPVYRKTLSYEHFNKIYGVYQHNPAVIFDDRFAMHYVIIVLDSIPAAQRLCNHSYPIDSFYHASAEPVSNSRGLGNDYDYWSQMPPMCKLSPLYSAQSEKMATLLLDRGASTNPQLQTWVLYDPLEFFA